MDRQLRRGGQVAFWLPPVFLIWSNLHSGFILGLILLVAIVAVETLGIVLGRRSAAERVRIGRLALATGCSAAACLINPNGAADFYFSDNLCKNVELFSVVIQNYIDVMIQEELVFEKIFIVHN